MARQLSSKDFSENYELPSTGILWEGDLDLNGKRAENIRGVLDIEEFHAYDRFELIALVEKEGGLVAVLEIEEVNDSRITMSSSWDARCEVAVPEDRRKALLGLVSPPPPPTVHETAWTFGDISIVLASILSAFSPKTVGSKVVKVDEFLAALVAAILRHDGAKDRVKGQMRIVMSDLFYPLVSTGVGKRSGRPEDYVLATHRGRVGAYLRRSLAAPIESLVVFVYTIEAMGLDPEVDVAELERVRALGATHVIVAVRADAGPRAPLTPTRFISNLAGGNREADLWSADEIRKISKEVVAYDDEWAVVADAD